MSKPATVRTTGAIWSLFYADKKAWPEGSYHDDTLVAINGKESPDIDLETLPLDATIEIRSGYVMLPDGSDVDLCEHFNNWESEQAGRGVAVGSFRVSKANLQAVRQAILAAGGELLE